MRESDIRPDNLFQEYLRLSAQDAEKCFLSQNREIIGCPGCLSCESRPAFQKYGFDYIECTECGSLYLSPRPPLNEFQRFYSDSPSSNFWARQFFPAVAEIRRDKIFVPRVDRISEICSERKFKPRIVVDVGAGYGIFLEEWGKRHPESHLCAVEPGESLARICLSKGFEVLQDILENAASKEWSGKADLATCFEVIEHVHNTNHFIKSLYHLVKPGGVVVVSGLGVDGFDIQMLWEKSNSVSPPHHINFMSTEGFESLFRRAGFTDVKVSTPGKLDTDIVFNAFTSNPEILANHRFVRLLMKRGNKALGDFQNFLANYNLSSHTWVIAKKPA